MSTNRTIDDILAETQQRLESFINPETRLSALVSSRKDLETDWAEFLAFYNKWYVRRFSFGHTTTQIATLVGLKIRLEELNATALRIFDELIFKNMPTTGARN